MARTSLPETARFGVIFKIVGPFFGYRLYYGTSYLGLPEKDPKFGDSTSGVQSRVEGSGP